MMLTHIARKLAETVAAYVAMGAVLALLVAGGVLLRVVNGRSK